MPKQRLDNLLVTTGLAENKSKARAMIMAGEVTVAGKATGRTIRKIFKQGLTDNSMVIAYERAEC